MSPIHIFSAMTGASSGSTTRRPRATPGSSAETRTGAARSGFPAIISSSRRSSATTNISGIHSRSRCRRVRAAWSASARPRMKSRGGSRGFFWPTAGGAGPCMADAPVTPAIRTSRISFFFMNIFTATTDAGSAPAIKPAGPRWRCARKRAGSAGLSQRDEPERGD